MPHPRPLWASTNTESVAREAAPYTGMTPEERAEHLRRVCRAGWRMLRSRNDWRRVLEHTDPIPSSTGQALARLRAEHRR